jgi:hypothetical protein
MFSGVVDARHTVPDATNRSDGHVTPRPVQFSATSQIPPDARHTVVVGW